jgi:hypothetical protein
MSPTLAPAWSPSSRPSDRRSSGTGTFTPSSPEGFSSTTVRGHPIPYVDTHKAELVFRHKTLRLLRDKDLITEPSFIRRDLKSAAILSEHGPKSPPMGWSREKAWRNVCGVTKRIFSNFLK